GKAYRLGGSQTDITLRKHTEQRLLHEALHDSLTKLPNRILFRRRLQEVFECFKAHLGPGFAVLFMDMDRFKTINDSLGHLVGDQLLCAITRRLENCLPPGRTIARLGGDEFAILLESLSVPGDALRVAKRILDALEHPFQVQQHTIFATGCIGIALSNSQYVNPEEILRDADTAMYRAKAVGLGQYQVFDAAMHTRAMEIWRLETDLRRAVERHEFSIHYQPIVSLASGRLAGFEALMRWNHPERGLLFPGEFLAVADETGLLTTIDRWMILNGAKQIKKWQEKFPNSANLFLSLNLSDGLINQPDLPDFIGLVLQETKVDPRTIKLEITERVIAYEWSSLHQTLARLRGMNIQLSLDDFGTGYSSLSSLHSYPVDVLKIASNFVSAMTNDNSALEIVRTIITLAHDLHLQVIAEGV
ncbi:MAG TPA: EAL domain-containing protein, partial [Caldilineaceae bacterium]|nr:EAL domain-containing protein [Caldilineaceae bacterium]